MIPGLENAILNVSVMHRNIYYNSPNNLKLAININYNNLFAGQITGVEGYVESVGSGLVKQKL